MYSASSYLVYEEALTPTTTKKTDKFGTLITLAKPYYYNSM